MKKRVVIDETMCRQVQLMLLGGAKIEEAARITGTSVGTIGRIKKADFNIDKFNENKARRRMEENGTRTDGELPGQIAISLPAEEPKNERSEQTKMMRFQAGKFNELDTTMQQGMERIAQKLDRINDTLCQILRAIQRE